MNRIETGTSPGAPRQARSKPGELPGYELAYRPRPSWETYGAVLELAAIVRADLRDLRPRDMIDIQSFLWGRGSDEYA